MKVETTYIKYLETVEKPLPTPASKSQLIIIPDQGTMTKVEGSTGDLIRKACFAKIKNT